MNWVLDGVTAVLIVLMIWIGGRRGAVRTIVEFIGFVAAVAVALLFSGWVADTVYQLFLREPLLLKTEEILSESMGNTLVEQVESVAAALPEFVTRFFDSASLAEQVQAAVSAGATDGAKLLAEGLIGPLLVLVLRAVATVVLFVVVMIVFHLLARAADLVAKLPVLNQLNKGLGMVCGAAKAALLVLLLAAALRAAMPFLPADVPLNAETVEQTVFFDWIYTHNPLYDMIAPV